MLIYDKIAIGNRAYAARTNRNLKQDDVSDVLGIHQSTYSKFENGRYDMPLSELIALCNYLGITVSWLIGEKDNSLTESDLLFLEKFKQFLISERKK
jgi:transcriptional regulator with XRE-family HTH domain